MVDGKIAIFDFDPIEWHFLPQLGDIAVSPNLPLNEDLHEFSVMGTNFFVTDEMVGSKSIGVGDDVFMVGRFVDHDGGTNNVPAVRFGSISVMPTIMKEEPNSHKSESYCIDLHSRTGFSGSPVFVYRTIGTDLNEIFRTKTVTLSSGSVFVNLLGIHWGQFPEAWKDAQGNLIRGLSGMTCVIPAKRIVKLLNTEKLRKERQADDQKQLEKFSKEGFHSVPE
jgi:hypothetical protein